MLSFLLIVGVTGNEESHSVGKGIEDCENDLQCFPSSLTAGWKEIDEEIERNRWEKMGKVLGYQEYIFEHRKCFPMHRKMARFLWV